MLHAAGERVNRMQRGFLSSPRILRLFKAILPRLPPRNRRPMEIYTAEISAARREIRGKGRDPINRKVILFDPF